MDLLFAYNVTVDVILLNGKEKKNLHVVNSIYKRTDIYRNS